jgi:small-conductance mechanosensitive channel
MSAVPEGPDAPGRERPEESPPEAIRQREDVREALRQAGSEEPAVARLTRRDRMYLACLAAAALLFGALALLGRNDVGIFERLDAPLALHLLLAAFLIAAVLIADRVLDALVISRIENRASQYNVRRVRRLITALAIAVSAATSIFANWTTTLASLGILSIVAGLALQAPLSSFFGWIYILVKHPYRVGDRIEINDAAGDVIDVGYLDTTLWEVGGKYISGDHPSGRVIKFPNSRVFNNEVYNYSWPLFPYIWNEIRIPIGFDADFPFVARALQEVAAGEVGANMRRRVGVFRDLLSKTPVDKLHVREEPTVFFRVNPNSWIDATLRYLVSPKNAGQVKSRLMRALLGKLQEHPEKFRFPKGDSR